MTHTGATRKLTRTWLLAATLCLSSVSRAAPLEGELSALEPLLGTWEVEAAWTGGQTIWARAQYSVGIGGRTVEGRVLVQDGDGAPYPRYFSLFAYDSERDRWVAHTFQPDGSDGAMDFDFVDGVLTTEWSEGETTIRDRSELVSPGELRWTVEMAGPGSAFEPVMDGIWHRVEDEMRQPIDTNLFATDADPRPFVRRTVIEAPVETVYAAWTDDQVFPRVYDPGNEKLTAAIDLAVGGRYEWLWDGVTGSNGCQVLSFIPNRMISFSWNAPPEQAESRAQRTWVVVEFSSTGENATEVTLTHLGFGSEPYWEETREYFGAAWTHVLGQFQRHLEAGEGTGR